MNRLSRQRFEGGFTLVEVMMALVVVGFALLLAAAAVHQQLLATDRFEARRQALRILEAGYEGLRSGAYPATMPFLDLAIEEPPDSRLQAYSLVAESRPTGIDGLHQVRLIMRWRWRDQAFSEVLETRIYRP